MSGDRGSKKPSLRVIEGGGGRGDASCPDGHHDPSANAGASLAAPASPHKSRTTSYAELHCLSDFSFGRGASSVGELFERAQQQGYRALAITDECSLAGIVRALEASRITGLKLIVGSEITLDADGDTPLKLVLLVETRAGYSTLCKFITRGRRRSEKANTG